MNTYDYAIFGMRLRSDRPLPFLATWKGGDDCPIGAEVNSASVPPFAAGVVTTNALFDTHQDGRVIVHPQDGPRILVDGGRRMTVDDCSVSDAYLHTWLFGTGIGTLFHQRARPPLHAAVLNIAGRGVMLAGDAGAGKSTTARALLARGHRLLSDDIGVVDPQDWKIQPGFPSMKLFADSARRWGDTLDQAMKVSAEKDKYHVPLSSGFQTAPIAMALLVVLKADEESTQPVMIRIAHAQAANLVHRFVYRRQIGKALDGGRAVFEFSIKLARAIPVVHLRRPSDFTKIDILCSLIEDAAESPALVT